MHQHIPITYRIKGEYRDQRFYFCGFGGRFWFAKTPNLATIEYKSHWDARQVIETFHIVFDRVCVFMPDSEPHIMLPSEIRLSVE